MSESDTTTTPLLANYVIYKYGDFEGIEHVRTDRTKGSFKLYPVHGGLPQWRDTEPPLTEAEMRAYAVLLETWRAEFWAWFFEAPVPPGPRSLQQLKQNLFYELAIGSCADHFASVRSGNSPFEIMPSVKVFKRDADALGCEAVFKLTYARKRWMLASGSLSPCIDSFDLKTHEHTVLVRLNGEHPAPFPGWGLLRDPEGPDDAEATAPTAHLLHTWAVGAKAEFDEFVRGPGPLGRTLPFALACKYALLGLLDDPTVFPDVILCARRGLRVPRFIPGPEDADFEEAKALSLERCPAFPVYLDSGVDRKHYTLWSTVWVPHPEIARVGIDAVLAATNAQ
jgi:hypothetical protein